MTNSELEGLEYEKQRTILQLFDKMCDEVVIENEKQKYDYIFKGINVDEKTINKLGEKFENIALNRNQLSISLMDRTFWNPEGNVIDNRTNANQYKK